MDLRERLEASYRFSCFSRSTFTQMLRAIRNHEEDICKLFLATVADLASITVHGVTDVKQVLTHLRQTLGRLVSGRRPSA